MKDKMKALVLCTGNSCRSHMAEAIINNRLGERWEAFSAGTEPAGYVHPKAIQVLREIGIDHSGVSKHAEVFRDVEFDVVITVCDDAEENCPAWLGPENKVHIGLPDPAKVTGTEIEILNVFRAVRDAIDSNVVGLLKQWESEAGE